MPTIKSVYSNVTINTFNSTDTGDRTIQAGNTLNQRNRRALFKTKSPIIEEEGDDDVIMYDLSGSRDSGSSRSVNGINICSNERSTSKTKEVIYDLIGRRSSEEFRAEMQKTLAKQDNASMSGETKTASPRSNDMTSWFNTIFCGYADTTTYNDSSTVATLEKTDSDSSLNNVDKSSKAQQQVPRKNQPISFLLSDVGKRSPSKGESKSENKPSIAKTDAMLVASVLKDSSSMKSPRSRRSPNKSVPLVDASKSPHSPTKLEKGAGSLDIVMELQCDEEIIIDSDAKCSKKKGIFRKKRKSKSRYKPTEVQGTKDIQMEKVAALKDTASVVSERSLFSFASNIEGSSSISSNAPIKQQGSAEVICITGPVNGTFLNITSEDDAENSELVGTYDRFRVHERSVVMILNRFATSIPLYHWQGKSQALRIKTSDSACSEDLGLRSFSHLGLNSSSMRSTTDNEMIPVDLINVCSEPSASGFDVRSSSYFKDGKKSPSGETMFALLGADNIIKNKIGGEYRPYDVFKCSDSYLKKLTGASKSIGLKTPFLIVVNFVVPWGNLLSYYYRPDATDFGPFCANRKSHASEKLWKAFMTGDESFRNNTLKFIPKILVGPWALKKLVGTQPTMIGQKIPTQYFGSIEEGYLEICMDVTKGGKMANSICSAVASKASVVSIDLAFLLQGNTHKELPEQLLTTLRLHHVSLKKEKHRIEV